MRKSFLKKSYTKFDGETSPRAISKKSKLKFYTVCLIFCPSGRLPKYIETALLTICFYLI